MKITNEQLIALQKNEDLRKKGSTAEGFSELLASEIESTQSQVTTSMAGFASDLTSGTTFAGIQKISQDSAVFQADLVAMEMQNAAIKIDSAFSDLEKYADELESSENDGLKKAYSLLDGLSKQVAELRSAYPAMENTSPQLASMVNELDVMTSTEMFKFNRGDYL